MFTTLATSSIFLLFVSQVSSKWIWGGCPSPTLVSNFDASQYLGVWYEQARDKHAFFEDDDCTTTEYTTRTDGKVGVLNTQFNLKKQKFSQAKGTAKFKGARGSVTFPVKYWFDTDGDYRVLDTDYTSYSIVYSCSDFLNIAGIEYVWILTRDETITDTTLDTLKAKLWAKRKSYGASSFKYPKQGGTC